MQLKRPNWKEIIDSRRKENFVGRADYLRLFSDNFSTEVPAFLLFSVTGEGGVGKSTLLKQYETIATSTGIDAITVLCDDGQLTPVAVMGHIAEKLARFDIKHKDFDERYKTYRGRRDEIESDPKAPRGALNLVVRGMTDFAIKAARRTPGVGVFAEYVDEKEAGEALAQGVSYLVDRFSNRDEVQLLREPENILTPLFMELLNRACEKQRVVLMFDVFERTCEAIEPWLRECLNFKYGECDTYLTFICSGRDPLDQHWTEIASSICHVVLEPFTMEETRLYLVNRNITDESLVRQIHDDTGGLPVLIELLAGTNPIPGMPLPDISKDAVTRFLQWIPKEERQHVALLAAIPRQFNLDILSACLRCNGADHFSWLSMQSYIRTSTTRGWFYHEKVRELMLRYLRNTVPSDLTSAHKRLADVFEARQNQLGLVDKSAYASETWRRLEIEKIYHLLCEQPSRNIGEAVNAFLRAFQWRWGFSESIAQACQQAGREMASQELQECAHILIEFYRAYDKDDDETHIRLASILARRNDLHSKAESALFASRGQTYRQMDKYPEALADFDRAIALDENYTRAIANRGQTYGQMGKFEEALSDFDRAIALDENYTWAIVNRGQTYRQMDKYAEALADFDRATTLDENYKGAIANRGITYHLMGRYTEALADFDRAIALDENYTWAIVNRGQTYGQMGKFEEALSDFDRAVELNNQHHWAFEQRGLVLGKMNRYEEAIDSLTEAANINSSCTTCIANRGLTYRQMDKYPEALADFNRLIALDEKDAWAIVNRGEAYYLMGRYTEALADFDRAIELNSQDHWVYEQRGIVLKKMKHYEEAIDSLTEAEKIESTCACCVANRGEAYHLMGRYTEALADFDRAIELDNQYHWAYERRGLVLGKMNRYEEAIASLTEAEKIDSTCSTCVVNRGLSYRLMGRYVEAMADFDRAIALDKKSYTALAWRGEMHRRLGSYEAAIQDLSLAIQLDSENDNFQRSRRVAVYQAIGDLISANTDIALVNRSPSGEAPDFYNKAVVCALSDRTAEAVGLLKEAIRRDSSARDYAKTDDLFDPLKNIPEFQELISMT